MNNNNNNIYNNNNNIHNNNNNYNNNNYNYNNKQERKRNNIIKFYLFIFILIILDNSIL